MSEPRKFGRSIRWTWAFAVMVLFHLALYWGVALTRDSDQKLRRQYRQFAEIQYFDQATTEGSDLLSQQMSLFDPRPLMLPTKWNAANAASDGETWQEEAEIFPDFLPMFELEDGNYVDDFGNVPANYDNLSVAQTEFGYPPFRQLGRVVEGVEFVRDPGISLSIVDPSTGEEKKSVLVYNEAVKAIEESWPNLKPATMLATIKDSFQVGGLSVLSSSGFDEADRRLGAIAYSNFSRLGLLEDGVYLLEIVP